MLSMFNLYFRSYTKPKYHIHDVSDYLYYSYCKQLNCGLTAKSLYTLIYDLILQYLQDNKKLICTGRVAFYESTPTFRELRKYYTNRSTFTKLDVNYNERLSVEDRLYIDNFIQSRSKTNFAIISAVEEHTSIYQQYRVQKYNSPKTQNIFMERRLYLENLKNGVKPNKYPQIKPIVTCSVTRLVRSEITNGYSHYRSRN